MVRLFLTLILFSIGIVHGMEDPNRGRFPQAGTRSVVNQETTITAPHIPNDITPVLTAVRFQPCSTKVIDNFQYMKSIKALLPGFIEVAKQSWKRKMPSALLVRAKELGEKPLFEVPHTAPLKELETKVYQMHNFLSLIGMHQALEGCIREAAVNYCNGIETAQRPFEVKGYFHSLDLPGERPALYKTTAVTLEGDIGYTTYKDGETKEYVTEGKFCCISPEFRSFITYCHTNPTIQKMSVKEILDIFSDAPEVKAHCLQQMSHDFQHKGNRQLQHFLFAAVEIARQEKSGTSYREQANLVMELYRKGQAAELLRQFIAKNNFSSDALLFLQPIQNLITLSDQLAHTTKFFDPHASPHLPLKELVNVLAQLEGAGMVLYSPEVREAHELVYQKGYTEFADALGRIKNLLRHREASGVFKLSPLEQEFSYKGIPFLEQLFATDGFIEGKRLRDLLPAPSTSIRQVIQPTEIISHVTEATVASEGALKLPERKNLQEKRQKKNALKRAARRKRKEVEFKLEELNAALAEYKAGIIPPSTPIVKQEAGVSLVPMHPQIKVAAEHKLPGEAIKYSWTLQDWLNGAKDQDATPRELFYHKYPPEVDIYVKAFGTQSTELWGKQKKEKITVFEMPGEIHYSDGRIVQVKFRMCLAAKHKSKTQIETCIHHELKLLKEASQLGDYAKTVYELHFPKLGQESSYPQPMKINKSAVLGENKFCVYLQALPGSEYEKIVLYKPIN